MVPRGRWFAHRFFIDSEIFERLRSSKYTPSVSFADSSLREGAGEGLYHSTYRPKTARLRAIFIAPTEGGFHSTEYSLMSGVTGDFHRPEKAIAMHPTARKLQHCGI